jgi:hypothetical protein
MSLSGAGDVVHLAQIGASQVPLFLVGTFQSHASVARLRHAHRCLLRVPHTIALKPFGKVTRSQAITEGASACRP